MPPPGVNERALTCLPPSLGISFKVQRGPDRRNTTMNTPGTPGATVWPFQDPVPGGTPKPMVEARGLGKGIKKTQRKRRVKKRLKRGCDKGN